ncbi:MAG: hypothetical protein ABJA78_16940 [Ferruginibacter sp.]
MATISGALHLRHPMSISCSMLNNGRKANTLQALFPFIMKLFKNLFDKILIKLFLPAHVYDKLYCKKYEQISIGTADCFDFSFCNSTGASSQRIRKSSAGFNA